MAEQREAWQDRDDANVAVGAASFVVMVRLGGRVRRLAAASAEEAQAIAVQFGVRQPAARVFWMARADLSTVAYFAGRYLPILPGIRAVDRVTHVFALAPGVRVDADKALIALCGEPIIASLLEIVPAQAGYPCWRCRVKVPGPATPDVPQPSGMVLPMSGPLPEHDRHRTLSAASKPTACDDGRPGWSSPFATMRHGVG